MVNCYPFGMLMPGMSYSSGSYRYGFNGYEKDDEVAGNGNHVSFEDYGYNPRTARRWNIDPLWKAFPFQSPYVYALNNPIRFMDVDGEGPGDGVQKLYVTTTTIKTSRGNEVVYLKKRYYENATVNQVMAWKDAALTQNGWYFATKDEYELYQKNPNQGAFSALIYGADTPEKYREWGDAAGSFLGQPLELRGHQVGKIKIASSGVDADGNEVTQTYTFSIVDAKGNEVGSESQTVTGEGSVSFNYALKDGQAVVITTTGDATTHTATLGTQARTGNRAPDTLDSHGTEMPNDQDKMEIGRVLEKKKR